MSATITTDTNHKRKRLWPIFLNALRTIISPAIALIIAFSVIQLYSKEDWGIFVPFLLYFHLANIITNWGSKDFLVRDFSHHPGNMRTSWQSFFIARIPILIIAQLVAFALFPLQDAFYLIGCLALSYISNAYVPIINDRRDYGKVIIVESASLLVFLAGLYIIVHPNIQLIILQNYLIYQAIRAGLYTILFASFFQKMKWRINWLYVKKGTPFFFLAITGFLQAKLDLYIFKGFSSKIELANYQIISGFLIFLQGMATIILLPYVRNIYRMKRSSIIRIARILAWLGVPLSILAIGFLYFVLLYIFEINLTLYQIAAIGLITYPSFLYAVHVFYGFSTNNEKRVVIVSLISAITNGMLSFLFLSLELNITGVLLAHGIAQVVALFGFRSLLRK
jgi:O-antigen/teichoic acid export membrane protein